MTPRRQNIMGWLALALSVLITCLWAFWGIIENFHEGWFYDSLARNVALMFIQYLSPMVIFLILTLVSVRWPRIGSSLHLLMALMLALYFSKSYSTGLALITTIPLVLLAALYWFGRPDRRRLAYRLALGLPMLTLLVFCIEPVSRVAGRVNDGNLDARRVDGNAVSLTWAPEGPGWPREGVAWQEAMRRCRYLSEDGTTLADTPQDIWRLPSVDEAVRSMARHGTNCGGVWDPRQTNATYEVRPDKESPLWNIHSPVIYWWTATEVNEKTAYIIVYDGRVWPRNKYNRPGYLAFRAVKEQGTR
jgi:hypothetical protein